MWAADPVAQVLTTAVSPDEAPLVKVSPSVNFDEALSVPEFLYLTNNVSGSVPSVATVFTTSATTPGQQENFNTITEQQEHFKELRSNLKTRNHRRHLLQGGNGAVNIEGEKVEAGRRRHLLNGANGEGS